MKHWLLITACLLSMPTLVHAEEILRIYNWADYMDLGVIEDFQRTRGVKVDYHTFTDASELMDALKRGERFDLVFPTDHQLHELVRSGLIALLAGFAELEIVVLL